MTMLFWASAASRVASRCAASTARSPDDAGRAMLALVSTMIARANAASRARVRFAVSQNGCASAATAAAMMLDPDQEQENVVDARSARRQQARRLEKAQRRKELDAARGRGRAGG